MKNNSKIMYVSPNLTEFSTYLDECQSLTLNKSKMEIEIDMLKEKGWVMVTYSEFKNDKN